MPDEKETTAPDPGPASHEADPRVELTYESNPKHRDPWQAGRKGSICEPDVRPEAASLLSSSVTWEGKRYAVFQGRAYCAQEHSPNRWHGYPVGWVEVPAKLARRWIREAKLTNHDRKRYWESH